MIEFTVRGDPKPKGSTRAFAVKCRDGRIRAVTTAANKGTKTWEQDMRDEARKVAPPELLSCPVKVSCHFFVARPKSVSQKKRPRPSVKPDLDKLMRTVLDALTGVVWQDDAQVVEMVGFKDYGDAPGALIQVQVVQQ